MKNRSWLIFAVLLLIPARSFAVDIGQVLNTTIGGVKQLSEATKDITPSEEHYIGRAVAATLLSQHSLLDNVALTKYVNEVGLTVARASDRPSTYGGYHFAVINSAEPNAYACPGGLIFISKGLLNLLKNEDELAAVLAHEVAHVAHRDGINTIKKERWSKLGFYAVQEAGKYANTPGDLRQVVDAFQGVVTDVAKKVIDSGYSKGDENKADASGMQYMATAGYNPAEMVTFLNELNAKGIGITKGPFSSHPKIESRIKSLEKQAGGAGKTEAVRTARFKATVAVVR